MNATSAELDPTYSTAPKNLGARAAAKRFLNYSTYKKQQQNNWLQQNSQQQRQQH